MSDSDLKVSVCVVTYNHEKYIYECLESIVTQVTSFKFEVLVSDDASTDGTPIIIREYAARYPNLIKPIINKRNVGPVANYFSVHGRAQGEYVAHIDGDDLMIQGKLSRQVQEFESDSSLVICWHKMNYIDDYGRTAIGTGDYLFQYPGGIVTLELALRYGSPGAHSSVMYRRSLMSIDLPDYDVLDMFISWSFLEHGNGKIIPIALGKYRVGVGISSTNKALVRNLNVHHASHFYKRHPVHKKSIFLFSFANAIVELKNFRKSFFGFGALAIKTFEPMFLLKLPAQLFNLKKARRPPLKK
jgi:glycosyltransferase involved in cell wall biosynthesis